MNGTRRRNSSRRKRASPEVNLNAAPTQKAPFEVGPRITFQGDQGVPDIFAIQIRMPPHDPGEFPQAALVFAQRKLLRAIEPPWRSCTHARPV